MKYTFRNCFSKIKINLKWPSSKIHRHFIEKLEHDLEKFDEASMTAFSMLCVNGPLASNFLIYFLFSYLPFANVVHVDKIIVDGRALVLDVVQQQHGLGQLGEEVVLVEVVPLQESHVDVVLQITLVANNVTPIPKASIRKIDWKIRKKC